MRRAFPYRRKILVALFTAAAAMTITFFLLRMMPGDIVHMIALELQEAQGVPYNEAYELAKAQLNYDPDAPVLNQFLKYVRGLASGNLGVSLVYKIPVTGIRPIITRTMPRKTWPPRHGTGPKPFNRSSFVPSVVLVSSVLDNGSALDKGLAIGALSSRPQ